MWSHLIVFVLLLTLISYAQGVLLPLTGDEEVCMIIMSYSEPINVEIKTPKIPGKVNGEKFQMTLISYSEEDEPIYSEIEENTIFRKNFILERSKLYNLCMSLNSERTIETGPIYVEYSASESFEQLIGKIDIPTQLSKEENLKGIYVQAKKTIGLSKIIAGHQAKERELQQKLIGQNVHKNNRIVTLTLIEILVVIASGTYQIFALRKFLMEKNLY